MKVDCILMDECYLPASECNDNCKKYKTEDHPFAIQANRDCEKFHNEKNSK